MKFTTILLEREPGIATITLNQPQRLNLLDNQMIAEIKKALDSLKNDDNVGVVIITGAGEQAFSAGVDLKLMRELDVPRAREFIQGLHNVCKGIRELPKLVIAAINGACFGGSFELALSCDIRIASENAQLGLPEIRVGIPSVIEAALMARLIGIGKTKEFVFTGDIVDAYEAERLGLVNKVVSLAQLSSMAREMATKILDYSPTAVRVQKDVINKWMTLDLEAAIDYSINAFSLCFATEEPKEAMNAFLEKRKPCFRKSVSSP